MNRIFQCALAASLLVASVAHARIANRCNLTPDMDYLMVATNTVNGTNPTTHVAGPDWFPSGGEIARRIADRASLQAGKAWLRLPDGTPPYCEMTVRVDVTYDLEIFDDDTIRWKIHVFSLPRDRWTHARNQGVAGFFRALDEWYVEDAVTVSARVDPAARSWLADYYADLEREIEALDDRLAELDEDAPAAATARGEDHYLAVATSPPAGTRIAPGEPGYFGIGWHTESIHDAGTAAVAECRGQGGGSDCSFNASGTSLRGGCVGLAIARWRDRDRDPERTYVVTSSSFRNLIAGDLRSGCERDALGGKYEGTVAEHTCEIVRIACAADVVAGAGGP